MIIPNFRLMLRIYNKSTKYITGDLDKTGTFLPYVRILTLCDNYFNDYSNWVSPVIKLGSLQ